MFHIDGSLNAVVVKGLIICLSKDFEFELNCSDREDGEGTLRLHQFVCTAFRSELNVAENGAGKQFKSLVPTFNGSDINRYTMSLS